MIERIQQVWDRIQDLFDISGDIYMGLFTMLILVRIVYVLKGAQPLTASEAACYGSAVGAFAYSNTGRPKS